MSRYAVIRRVEMIAAAVVLVVVASGVFVGLVLR